MNPSEIKQIIDAVCSTDIKKFKYANHGVKIEIDRNECAAVVGVTQVNKNNLPQIPVQAAYERSVGTDLGVAEEASTASASVASTHEPNAVEASATSDGKALEVVASPIVGVFYASPTPESPSYAAVGKLVKKGEILCIVEAMKVMNEITAEYDLKVVEVMTSNEQLVEFGQPLFKVERQ